MKRRIACFHLYNDYSGSPKVLALILQSLLKDGVSVSLLTSNGPGALNGLEEYGQLKRHTFCYRFREKHRILTLLNYLAYQIYTFFFCLRYIGQKEVIFYLNTLHPVGAALCGKLMGNRVIYHYHENAFAKGKSYRLLAWFMQVLADDIICVSEYQASFLKRKEKIHVIPNAVVENFLSQVKYDPYKAFEQKNILLLSSLKEYKGIRHFVTLAQELAAYSFTLVLNEDIQTIEDWRKSIAIPENLIIFPRQENVIPFYEKASMVLNLTDKTKAIETFGLTVLEAFAAGIPVIVPTVGGVAELVKEGENGYHIDCQELNKIKETIHQVLSDKNLYLKLASNAFQRSKEFSLEKQVGEIHRILFPDRSDLFLELVQVSLGTRDKLSRTPDKQEWEQLFKVANIQTLLGITLTGIQNYTSTPLLYKWCGWSMKIKAIHQTHVEALGKVNTHLREKGIVPVFMKGLICGRRYPTPELRQCGDIDFVVREDQYESTLAALEEIATVKHDLKHEHHGMAWIDKVQLEPHFKIHNYQNPSNDKTMKDIQQELFTTESWVTATIGTSTVACFPPELEGMFLVSHMVNHVFAEGLGLRQVIDFAFWCKENQTNASFDKQKYFNYLDKMHMRRAGRIFGRIAEIVVNLPSGWGCMEALSEQETRFTQKLLDDILKVGNFARGQFHPQKRNWTDDIYNYWWVIQRVWKLHYLCPSEAYWWPFSKVYRYLLKKKND